MSGKTIQSEEVAGRLRQVLLDYLQATRVIRTWPGVDGLTIDDIVAFYPAAVAAGEVPDWQELLSRHPELATALQEWLAVKERWQFAFRRCGELPSADHQDAKAQS